MSPEYMYLHAVARCEPRASCAVCTTAECSVQTTAPYSITSLYQRWYWSTHHAHAPRNPHERTQSFHSNKSGSDAAISASSTVRTNASPHARLSRRT